MSPGALGAELWHGIESAASRRLRVPRLGGDGACTNRSCPFWRLGQIVLSRREGGAANTKMPQCTILKELDFSFWLRIALRDRPKGPSTANHQPPPTTNHHQPPTAANRQRQPTANRQPLPTAINANSANTKMPQCTWSWQCGSPPHFRPQRPVWPAPPTRLPWQSQGHGGRQSRGCAGVGGGGSATGPMGTGIPLTGDRTHPMPFLPDPPSALDPNLRGIPLWEQYNLLRPQPSPNRMVLQNLPNRREEGAPPNQH